MQAGLIKKSLFVLFTFLMLSISSVWLLDQLIKNVILKPRAVKPLTLWPANQVSALVLKERTIKDPKIIEQFLAFISKHNDRWETASTTFPTFKHQILVHNIDSDWIQTVWFSDQIIGSRDLNSDPEINRLHSFSIKESNELKAILGIQE